MQAKTVYFVNATLNGHRVLGVWSSPKTGMKEQTQLMVKTSCPVFFKKTPKIRTKNN